MIKTMFKPRGLQTESPETSSARPGGSSSSYKFSDFGGFSLVLGSQSRFWRSRDFTSQLTRVSYFRTRFHPGLIKTTKTIKTMSKPRGLQTESPETSSARPGGSSSSYRDFGGFSRISMDFGLPEQILAVT